MATITKKNGRLTKREVLRRVYLNVICEELDHSDFNIAHLARRAHTTPRKLQRTILNMVKNNRLGASYIVGTKVIFN
jgi:hypothetical protein